MKLPPLSNRLLACCEFINPGSRVADIGCDHGYLGIYLLMKNIASTVIAADVNEQPLNSAIINAKKFNVQERISFHLSDGVRNIPRDFDTLVCAGMGADTIISILDAAPWLKSDKYHFVLQCQSRRPELRKYLYAQGYRICAETLAQDGKFIYPVLEAVYDPAPTLSPAGYYISPALLQSGSSLLGPFYQRIREDLATTVVGLSHSGGEKLDYYRSVLDELNELEDTIYGNR